MKAPLCRLCGHEHNGVDHVWGDEPKRNQRVTTGRNQIVTKPVVCNQCVTKDGEIAILGRTIEILTQEIDALRLGSPKPPAGTPKAKRDRAAYMREYRKAAA